MVRPSTRRGDQVAVAPSTDQVVVTAARVLGDECADQSFADVDAFHRTLTSDPWNPIRRVVAFVHSVCCAGRSRRLWMDVVSALAAPGLPPWVRTLVEDSFALYRVLRHRALPRAPLPPVGHPGSLRLGRPVVQALSQAGLPLRGQPRPQSLREEAALRTLALWETLRDRWFVLWFDNYYRMRYAHNPTVYDPSLNSTGMAMLHLP